MGAGNPLIRSFDEELYRPTTYFIDFTLSFKDKEAEAVKEFFEANDRDDFDTLSESDIQNELQTLIGYVEGSFREDFFFNIHESEAINTWVKPHESDRYVDALSASYRGYALIIAENEDTLILTTDEGEYHHFPFAIIPKFTYAEIFEELWDEHSHKEEWYMVRNRDLYTELGDKAVKLYEKKLDKWQKKYEPFMRWFHKLWGSQMNARNCAWTSHSIKNIGEYYKFL